MLLSRKLPLHENKAPIIQLKEFGSYCEISPKWKVFPVDDFMRYPPSKNNHVYSKSFVVVLK